MHRGLELPVQVSPKNYTTCALLPSNLPKGSSTMHPILPSSCASHIPTPSTFGSGSPLQRPGDLQSCTVSPICTIASQCNEFSVSSASTFLPSYSCGGCSCDLPGSSLYPASSNSGLMSSKDIYKSLDHLPPPLAFQQQTSPPAGVSQGPSITKYSTLKPSSRSGGYQTERQLACRQCVSGGAQLGSPQFLPPSKKVNPANIKPTDGSPAASVKKTLLPQQRSASLKQTTVPSLDPTTLENLSQKEVIPKFLQEKSVTESKL